MGFKSALIGGFAFAVLEYELAYFGSRQDRERRWAQVGDLQYLAVVDARLHKRGRYVHHEAEACESAAAFEPAGDMGCQADVFHGHAQYGFAGPHRVSFGRQLDQLREMVEVRIVGYHIRFCLWHENPQIITQ